MRIKNIIKIAAVIVVALVPTLVSAQNSSINTFSPFTFYGLGDFHIQGATNLRSMGGVGVGYRAPWISGSSGEVVSYGFINNLNPASLSATPRQTFHFGLDLEGTNRYLESKDKKSSDNIFNIKEISFQTPLYNRLAIGISLSPYSSVGYRSKIEETDPDILAELYQGGAIGANYLYRGDGDINQGKMSIGWEPIKNISIGVDMIYFFGKLNRSYTTNIITRNAGHSYINAQVSQSESISKIMWNFGLQYNIINTNHRVLTLGATYFLGGKLNPDINVVAVNATGNVQSIANGLAPNFKLPSTLSAGIFYQTWRIRAGIDYVYQNWAGQNNESETTGDDFTIGMSFRNTNTIKAGFEFTPDRRDIRSRWKRLTYRIGVHYSDYYMTFNDTNISDKAITLGLGIPFKANENSYIDVGLEFGQRGTTKNNLIKDNYFKVSVGFRLFGKGWFKRAMYH